VNEVLLVIDVLNDFEHEDGETLLASFRERLPALREALESARRDGTRVVYVNDRHGTWVDDAPGLVRRALAGAGGDVIEAVAPRPGEPVLLKGRYSGFDHTALDLLLDELGAERLLLAGGATEACVVQTGIDAREHGYQVTVLADACATLDDEIERVALRYAEEVAGMVVARAPRGEGG
jgi:nicotinamidase-related amidase